MGKLLLVEDNVILQETTRELLEALEYQVCVAGNGREAREVMAAHGKEIDLLLLDLSLPDIDGESLMQELASVYSGLRVVLCTGSLADDDLRRHPAVRGFLAKPFDLDELQRCVANALAG